MKVLLMHAMSREIIHNKRTFESNKSNVSKTNDLNIANNKIRDAN